MPVTIPNAYTLAVNLTQGGQPSVCVVGLRSAPGVFLTVFDAKAALDAFWAAFRPVIAGDVTVTSGSFAAVGTDQIVSSIVAPLNPTGGSSSTTSVHAYSTLIKWQSDQGGRRGKGRTYLPGLGTAMIGADGRSYTPTHRTNVGTAITNYLASSAFTSAGMQPAVISRKYLSVAQIKNGSLATVPGIQRRRMR